MKSKSSGIGGQAVLEGVMMKNKKDYAVAVRTPEGQISVTRGKSSSIAEKNVFFRLPVVRGVVTFVESLMLGMRTLTYSAGFYEEEENKAADDKKDDKKESIEMALTVVVSILLAVGIFMILPFFLSQLLRTLVKSPMVLAVIEGVIRIVMFIGYIVAISFMQDIKRVFMYHGAEHKSINCVESGLELTVENVRKSSKHHKRCGTSFLFIVMFISIIFFMFIQFKNIWLRMLSRILLVPVVAGVSYEFIKLAGSTDNKIVEILSTPGMLLQRLTTREPDDSMIEVAIASVEAVFDWRTYQRNMQTAASKEQINRSSEKGKSKKSRAQIREELKQREEENKLRASERARYIQELVEKEKELEKIADEADKRKAMRSLNIEKQEDDEVLAGLDYYFDDKKED